MNPKLAAAIIEAVSDDKLDANNPNYPNDPGVERKHMCSRFVRCASRKLYGQKYQGLFGTSAIETGENFRDAGFTVKDGPEPGDMLIKMVGSGGSGHIGGYLGEVPGLPHDDYVGENSSTSIGRVHGAKGYRRLGEFGTYQLIGRLPAPEQDEQTYRLIVGGRQVCMMPVIAGHSYCPLRTWGSALGFDIDWDEDSHRATINGTVLPADFLTQSIKDRTYVWISNLVDFAGLIKTVDETGHAVRVAHPDA